MSKKSVKRILLDTTKRITTFHSIFARINLLCGNDALFYVEKYRTILCCRSFHEAINTCMCRAISGHADNFHSRLKRCADLCTRHRFIPHWSAHAFAEAGHSLSRFLNKIAQNAVNCLKNPFLGTNVAISPYRRINSTRFPMHRP